MVLAPGEEPKKKQTKEKKKVEKPAASAHEISSDDKFKSILPVVAGKEFNNKFTRTAPDAAPGRKIEKNKRKMKNVSLSVSDQFKKNYYHGILEPFKNIEHDSKFHSSSNLH
jgi:hypothetical protein